MSVLLVIAKILVIVGGLNWGLVGAFEYNLVDTIFGEGSLGSQIVYIAVGVAALITIIDLFMARYGSTSRDSERGFASDRDYVAREPEYPSETPMRP